MWHITCVVSLPPFQGKGDYNSRNLLQREKNQSREKQNMSEEIYNESLPFLDDKYSFDESLFI